MTGDRNIFVVHRLRAKPVTYTVTIRHFVVDDEWYMGVTVNDVAEEDEINRERVADDLEAAARMLRDNALQSDEAPIASPPPLKTMRRCPCGCPEQQAVRSDNPFANCPRCGTRLVVVPVVVPVKDPGP